MKKLFVILLALVPFYVPAQTVYVAGWYSETSMSIYTKACYWVNGVRHELDGSYANKITVSDGKIYVTGYYKNSRGDYIRCYWVDGTRYDVPNCYIIFGIFVENNTVYVTGNCGNEPSTRMCYWVNGVHRHMPVVNNIGGLPIINNGKFYIPGYHNDKGIVKACYWVDGVRHELPNSENFIAESIAVVNGKTYVAALEAGNNNKRICYWIDNVQTIIPFPTNTRTLSMIVDSGNVWLMVNDCYYINGQRFNYPSTLAPFETIWPFVHKGKLYATCRGFYWADGVKYNGNYTAIYVTD